MRIAPAHIAPTTSSLRYSHNMRFTLIAVSVCALLFTQGSMAWRREVIQPKGFVLANNHFGLNLLEQLSSRNDAQKTKSNIFFSPFSISVALSMLHQGTNGTTAEELSSTLGFNLAKLADNNELVGREIRTTLNDLDESAENGSYVLSNANAMLSANDFDICDTYRASLTNNFNAEIFEADFKESDAVKQRINGWISNKTQGKIPELLKTPPSPSTKLILINAVYFKGSWKLKFNPNRTETGTFTDSLGAKYENVEFMHRKDYFNVGFLGEIQANLIELPYDGDELSFYAILPDDKTSDMEHIKKALNPWYLEAAIGRTYSQEVEIKFPKLNIKTEYSLVDTLQSMGVKQIFSGRDADFGGISNSSNLAVSEIKHAATLEVNEEGSEASAATYIAIVKLSLNLDTPTFEFDHPFLFFIRNNKNGNILFIGEVNQF